MAKRKQNELVSLRAWMWVLFVTSLPIVGQVMLVVWAFAGDNCSRQNYCRAVLLWALILIVLFVGIVIAGQWASLQAAG
jgi:hypothetical protein